MGFIARGGGAGIGHDGISFGYGPLVATQPVVQPAGGDSAAAPKRRRRPRLLLEYDHPPPAASLAGQWSWEDQRGRPERLLVAGITTPESPGLTVTEVLVAAAAAGAAAALLVSVFSGGRRSAVGGRRP